MQKLVIIISILMMASMASAASTDMPKASQTPGDTFYFLDKFSESLELTVAKAPVVGSSELEAKVRANHAAERLSEAKKLAEQNKSEKVDKLMAEYSKQNNLSVKSAKKANNTDLSKRLGNVSNNHVEVLQDVQRKVPEQAQKGIQNAIKNSQKNQKELGIPEVAKNKRKPGSDTGRPDKENSGKKGVSSNRSPADIQDKKQEAENLEKDSKNSVDNTSDSQNLDNKEETADETIENTTDKESKITGEAFGKPSKSGLP